MSMQRVRVCLSVGCSDSTGGSGVSADARCFSALGVHAACVITCATAQSSAGAEVFPLPAEAVSSQMRAVREVFEVGAVKVGMVGSPEAAEAVGEELEGMRVVADPVLRSSAGHVLQDEEVVEALMEHVFPAATLITPNLQEAEVLSGVRIRSEEDARRALLRLGETAEGVMITGLEGAADLLYWEGEVLRVPGAPRQGCFRGTGGLYAAAVAAELAKGMEVPAAVRRAKEYLNRCIARAYVAGGMLVPDCCAELRREAERYPVVERLEEAMEELLQMEGFVELIPQVGCNFVYALPEAESKSDVAGLTGRIVRAGRRAVAAGSVRFGGSSHLSRVVLAAQRVKPELRAVLNLRYSEEVVRAAERAGLRLSSFRREEEPPGVSTMEWGTLRALESCGEADVVYDMGGHGKEAMVRVLGRSPEEVLQKVERLILAMGHRQRDGGGAGLA